MRRLKSILSKEGIAEVRVKLAPTVAMSVLNQKRKDLADLEEAHDCHILILADPEVGYGEMAAEIEVERLKWRKVIAESGAKAE